MPEDRVIIQGSERTLPKAPQVGEPDPNALVEISLYLKRQPSDPSAPPLSIRSRASVHKDRATSYKPAMDQIEAFARQYGLTVAERHEARRLIQLSGPTKDMEAAFGTTLFLFDHPDGAYRGRSGPLTAPLGVAGLLEAVLGLDQRPIASPRSVRATTVSQDQAHLPNAVAALYGFPAPKGAGAGECIALIELGGGVSDADTKSSFKAMGLSPPVVNTISVGTGKNAPGKDPDADGEVALDVQVAGGAAPGAAVAVYFAQNTDQGFVDAITQAATDTVHKPSVMSISWGSAESVWTAQAVTAMNSAFQDALEVGISVFAASGDGLATDGVSDGKAHVDFPASSPWVVGCGGTSVQTKGLAIAAETVWNSNGGGTGGGISTLFAVPAYQDQVTLPPPANAGAPAGRGVPDVSSDADPDTGYQVVVDGKAQVIGGTSAAAPLWAGLFALINQTVGSPVGQPHARLYANPAAFNDIVAGDNEVDGIGYAAGPGWDACTGLGSPRGAALTAVFSKG